MMTLAFREIRNHRRFSLFFFLNLALGFLGFLSLDVFKLSLERSLSERSRTLLGADLSVSARRPLTKAEENLLQKTLPPHQETSLTELYSMVSTGRQSRLVEVVAVGRGYPFYGDWLLEQGGRTTSGEALFEKPLAWVDRELAFQLQVRKGDTLKIGEASVTIADIVLSHTVSGSRGMSLASRLYIAEPTLQSARLLRFGSTANYRRLIQVAPTVDVPSLSRSLDRAISDTSVRVTTHMRAGQQVGRMQGFLNDYLGLASLVSLFLASVGAGFLFRGFLTKRLREIAILRTLGLSPFKSQAVYIIELSCLGTAAAITALLASWLLLPLAAKTLGTLLAFPIALTLSVRNIVVALALGSIGTVVICLPYLLSLPALKPAMLYQEHLAANELKPRWVGVVPGLLLFAALAVWQAHSWKVGGLFAGVFFVSGLILLVVASAAARRAEAFVPGLALDRRLALRGLIRDRMGSVACFVSIALGTLLMTLIPQIQKSLSTELTQPDISVVPSLFLFDIQDEQLQPLTDFLRSKGHHFSAVSPLIRGRLVSVNGSNFEKELETATVRTREDETAERMRNRGFNLTYRSELSESEKLVRGKPFSGAPPTVGDDGTLEGEISVEQRFAKRLGVGLGDRLLFDVQEVPLSGRIVNIRQVTWTSFQPNFFVQFQPGLLEDAPKTWITSLAKLAVEKRSQLQNDIVQSFPTISIIDVSSVIERLLTIFSQMAWAIRWMAALSLFAGGVVLFSIASYQASQRRGDMLLLKILGSSRSLLQRIVHWEFGILGFFASSCGALLSIAVSFLFSRVLFDQVWSLDLRTPLIAITLATALSILTARWAMTATLRSSPNELLQ